MTLLYPIEILAMAVLAASGVMATRLRSTNLIDVILIGAVTATGGGTLRDIILDKTVFWIADVNYLIAPVLASAAVFWGYKILPALKSAKRALDYLDALGVALFASSATASTLAAGHAAPIAMVMGVFTGIAGGMMRDLLLNREPIVFGPTLYISPLIVGTGVYCLLMDLRLLPDTLALVLSFLIIAFWRLGAIAKDWQLPRILQYGSPRH